ncbi:hypothetical protein DUNSADRAFT_10501 [Dunaliella salina]|uniref:Uncharacterized protein n=1 Tax=Dunaliella salina TaxID=3046 RepID=A0ABQ7GF79_DUNSA|nr:hypothetical protein DUNSADRAFT_10501 [Dunaliella salina]|eukprot:KAF5833263.1 hypothetical protein DUNSADRAFT_10501 [Dunaliella salina]
MLEGLTSLLSWSVTWPFLSLAIWSCFVLKAGSWERLVRHQRRNVMLGVLACLLFACFLRMDPSFKGWGDVYYFCGTGRVRYCTCGYKWNMLGWLKGMLLWFFVLSSASGLRSLLLEVGLNGLLPGEEVVTREAVVSICWRLIPYWLNRWEQKWGAECSSMMFELPHFAMELLVILPCIQILCARMKVVVVPILCIPQPRNRMRGGRTREIRRRPIWQLLGGAPPRAEAPAAAVAALPGPAEGTGAQRPATGAAAAAAADAPAAAVAALPEAAGEAGSQRRATVAAAADAGADAPGAPLTPAAGPLAHPLSAREAVAEAVTEGIERAIAEAIAEDGPEAVAEAVGEYVARHRAEGASTDADAARVPGVPVALPAGPPSVSPAASVTGGTSAAENAGAAATPPPPPPSPSSTAAASAAGPPSQATGDSGAGAPRLAAPTTAPLPPPLPAGGLDGDGPAAAATAAAAPLAFNAPAQGGNSGGCGQNGRRQDGDAGSGEDSGGDGPAAAAPAASAPGTLNAPGPEGGAGGAAAAAVSAREDSNGHWFEEWRQQVDAANEGQGGMVNGAQWRAAIREQTGGGSRTGSGDAPAADGSRGEGMVDLAAGSVVRGMAEYGHPSSVEERVLQQQQERQQARQQQQQEPQQRQHQQDQQQQQQQHLQRGPEQEQPQQQQEQHQQQQQPRRRLTPRWSTTRRGSPFSRDDFAPDVLKGFWEFQPEQRKLMPRLR